MSDALFAMGVVGDEDDRPKQHAPRPVRCLDDDVVPVRPVVRESCAECRLSPRLEGRARCRACQLTHERVARARARWYSTDAEWRVYTRAVAQGGIVQATAANRHIIERLVAAGRMRWGMAAELERMSLPADGSYAVVPR